MTVQDSCFAKNLYLPNFCLPTGFLGASFLKVASFIDPIKSSLPSSIVPSFLSAACRMPKISLRDLSENNINVIDTLSEFRETLEKHNPSVMQNIFSEFTKQYNLHQGNPLAVQPHYQKALKNFEKIYTKILQKEFSCHKKKSIETAFKRFFVFFKALLDPNSLDAEAAVLVQDIKSQILHRQINRAIKFTREKDIFLPSLQDLQDRFHYKENKNEAAPYEETLKEFSDICKDITNTDFQDQQKEEIIHFFEELTLNPCQMAFALLIEFNETVIESHKLYTELGKVISYVENKHSPTEDVLQPLHKLKNEFEHKNLGLASKNSLTHTRHNLLNCVAEASAIIELMISEKRHSHSAKIHRDSLTTLLQEIEKVISLIKKDPYNRGEMRLSSEKTGAFSILKKKLQDLPKENPSLFTKDEQTFLCNLQKDLYAISYGRSFDKKTLWSRLNKCQEIITEILPKTPFTKARDLLCNLESCITNQISTENHNKITKDLASLNILISNPRIFIPTKMSFKELEAKFSSLDFESVSELLDSLAKTQKLFDPNERRFKDLRNEFSGKEHPDGKKDPDFQGLIDSLCPLKRTAFKNLKAALLTQVELSPSDIALDFLDTLIDGSGTSFQAEERTKFKLLKKKLSSIIPDRELLDLLDFYIENPKTPCKASKKVFDELKKQFSDKGLNPEKISFLYPLEKSAFNTLENKLSSLIPDQELLNLLDFLINNPNIEPDRKFVFKMLREKLISLDHKILNCLYPLEKSRFTNLKMNLLSFKQKGLSLFSDRSPFITDKNRIESLRGKLLSTPDQEALELLNALISDLSITKEKRQVFTNIRDNLSLLKKELNCSNDITPEELKKNLYSIIPNEGTLRNLKIAAQDPILTVEQKQVFTRLKSHLYSIKLNTTAYLSSLEESVKEENFYALYEQITDDLNSYIIDPRLPKEKKSILNDLKSDLVAIKQSANTYQHSVEKTAFENVIHRLSSLTPNQNLSSEETLYLQTNLQKCRKLVKKMEERCPPKERNQIAINQELLKLAKHTTNLSLMMLVNNILCNPVKDSLFYRNIIRKAGERSICPKKLLLIELQNEGVSKWKITAAKICFFMIKHLGVEGYTYRTISRIMTNYSKLLYQSLDREYNQDQFRSLIEKIIGNTTNYLQILRSAISNVKKNAQTQPDNVPALIIKELLSLQAQENETTLKDLDLNNLYTRLVDDIINKSESSILKYFRNNISSYVSKQIPSIIEKAIDSFFSPSPNGTASAKDVLLRGGLKTLYKKLPSIFDTEDSRPAHHKDIPLFITNDRLSFLTTRAKSKASKNTRLIDAFIENLLGTLDEYKATQQIVSSINIIEATDKTIEYMKTQSTPLQGVINQQIKDFESCNKKTKLKLSALAVPALQGEERQSFSLFPVVKNAITGGLFSNADEPILSTSEIVEDKFKNHVRQRIRTSIQEKLSLLLAELLEQSSLEDPLYDLFYQAVSLANQSIENPKEITQTQKSIKKEIAKLIKDHSFMITNYSLSQVLVKKYTDSTYLSLLAEQFMPSYLTIKLSSIIEEHLQNIADITEQKALFQPEAITQLGRRIILP